MIKKTIGNRSLKSNQYYFTEDGLYVEIQMHDTLYDQEEFYIGCNNWEVLILFSELDVYLIEDSAIDTMLQK